MCSRAAPGKARLRLVIENFQNDLLLFKASILTSISAAPRWMTMRIKEQWLGRRARIELLTRDDKTCVGDTKDQEEWEKEPTAAPPSAFSASCCTMAPLRRRVALSAHALDRGARELG